MFVRRLLRLLFHTLSALPSKEFLKIIAIGAITSEIVLVEEAFNAAARTNLVSAALGTDRPAHLAVPAAPQNYGGPRQTGRHQTHRPQPPRTLAF